LKMDNLQLWLKLVLIELISLIIFSSNTIARFFTLKLL